MTWIQIEIPDWPLYCLNLSHLALLKLILKRNGQKFYSWNENMIFILQKSCLKSERRRLIIIYGFCFIELFLFYLEMKISFSISDSYVLWEHYMESANLILLWFIFLLQPLLVGSGVPWVSPVTQSAREDRVAM